jgi:hypothetical protein|tara:strand:- start:87 stop:308 length:222 start_codon:yes stop_codon:yes gene_type:complete
MEAELYSLENLTLRDIKALRTALNYIQITGIDAFFIGTLQINISGQIEEIENHINSSQQTNSPQPPKLKKQTK